MNLDLQPLLALAAIALYLGAALTLRRSGHDGQARAMALLALLGHAACAQSALITAGALSFGLTATVSLFLWQCALLVWLLGLLRPSAHLGITLYPVSALALLAALLFPSGETLPFTGGWPLGLHVLLSLLAYGLLTIAAVQAIYLLVQDRGLRSLGPSARPLALPPLETMERLLFELMLGGFFLLSLALLSGLLFIEDMLAQHLAHKTILSLFAWMVFATLLWGRWRFGWRGRKAIHWTLGGYTALLLAYFGSKWVLEALLGRSWG